MNKAIVCCLMIIGLTSCGPSLSEKTAYYISQHDITRTTSNFDKDIIYKSPIYRSSDELYESNFGKDLVQATLLMKPNIQEEINLMFRAWENKKDGSKRYQIYFIKHYKGDWRYYQTANFTDGSVHELTLIDKSVDNCRGGVCKFTEIFGLNMPKDILVQNSQPINENIKIRLNAKSGHQHVFAISKKIIHGFLIATEDLPGNTTIANTTTVKD